MQARRAAQVKQKTIFRCSLGQALLDFRGAMLHRFRMGAGQGGVSHASGGYERDS